MYAGQTTIGSAAVTVEPGQIAIILHDPPAPPGPGTQRTQEEHARMTEWQVDSAIALVHAWRTASPPRPETVWVRMLMGMLCEVDDISEDVIEPRWQAYCDTQARAAQGTSAASNGADATNRGDNGEGGEAETTSANSDTDAVEGSYGRENRETARGKRHRDRTTARGNDAGTPGEVQRGDGTANAGPSGTGTGGIGHNVHKRSRR